MKSVTLYLSLFVLSLNALTQTTKDYWSVDTASSFNSPHSPYTDAISMWVLRQNLTVRAYQAYYNMDISETKSGSSNINNTLELYIPAISKGGFTAIVGTGFSRNHFMSDNDSLDNPALGFSQLWIPVQYEKNKWKFMLLYEQLMAGRSNSLFDNVGNTQRIFFTVSHSFNLKWRLTIFGVYYADQLEGKKNTTLMPAFELRYSPASKLTIAAGAPLLFGIEWSVTPKIDFYFSQMMLNETNSFISYNFTDKLALTLQYSVFQKGAGTYFFSENVTFNGINYNYNNIVQKQSDVALKLGFKTLKDIGLVIMGGYRIGDELNLYTNENKTGQIPGRNNFFAGFSIQYFKYF